MFLVETTDVRIAVGSTRLPGVISAFETRPEIGAVTWA